MTAARTRSPVHRHRKFSAVFGTTSSNSSTTTRSLKSSKPPGTRTCTSKYTNRRDCAGDSADPLPATTLDDVGTVDTTSDDDDADEAAEDAAVVLPVPNTNALGVDDAGVLPKPLKLNVSAGVVEAPNKGIGSAVVAVVVVAEPPNNGSAGVPDNTTGFTVEGVAAAAALAPARAAPQHGHSVADAPLFTRHAVHCQPPAATRPNPSPNDDAVATVPADDEGAADADVVANVDDTAVEDNDDKEEDVDDTAVDDDDDNDADESVSVSAEVAAAAAAPLDVAASSLRRAAP
jgi:hypothetical protein